MSQKATSSQHNNCGSIPSHEYYSCDHSLHHACLFNPQASSQDHVQGDALVTDHNQNASHVENQNQNTSHTENQNQNQAGPIPDDDVEDRLQCYLDDNQECQWVCPNDSTTSVEQSERNHINAMMQKLAALEPYLPRS